MATNSVFHTYLLPVESKSVFIVRLILSQEVQEVTAKSKQGYVQVTHSRPSNAQKSDPRQTHEPNHKKMCNKVASLRLNKAVYTAYIAPSNSGEKKGGLVLVL